MNEHDLRILAKKAKSIRHDSNRTKWGREREFCFACGAGSYGLHVLTTHEMLGGKDGRSQEPCNYFRCGWSPCHELASMLDVRGPSWTHRTMGSMKGDLLPKLPLGVVLSMRMRAEPLTEEELARLTELHGRPLPTMLPIPEHFVRLWEMNRGEHERR